MVTEDHLSRRRLRESPLGTPLQRRAPSPEIGTSIVRLIHTATDAALQIVDEESNAIDDAHAHPLRSTATNPKGFGMTTHMARAAATNHISDDDPRLHPLTDTFQGLSRL